MRRQEVLITIETDADGAADWIRWWSEVGQRSFTVWQMEQQAYPEEARTERSLTTQLPC